MVDKTSVGSKSIAFEALKNTGQKKLFSQINLTLFSLLANLKLIQFNQRGESFFFVSKNVNSVDFLRPPADSSILYLWPSEAWK